MQEQTVGRNVVVIGASAGGIEALKGLFAALPTGLPASMFVAIHRAGAPFNKFEGTDPLLTLLSTASCVVETPADGETIQCGKIYLAPVDRNMLVERGRIRVENSPREYLNSPSINALFRSAALAYGRHVVGVILSGMLKDGTAGLWQIKQRGGVAIVQDPTEAKWPSMPQGALSSVSVDYCEPVSKIALILKSLTSQRPSPPRVSGPRRARILIVEDERIVALNLEKQLGKLGYCICGSAATGDEAIDAVRTTLPELVLMDIRLAGQMDGTEAACVIWEQFQLPVVFLTAFADDETIDKVKRTQSYGYLLKPLNPTEVHAVIQVALERRDKELNEAP